MARLELRGEHLRTYVYCVFGHRLHEIDDPNRRDAIRAVMALGQYSKRCACGWTRTDIDAQGRIRCPYCGWSSTLDRTDLDVDCSEPHTQIVIDILHDYLAAHGLLKRTKKPRPSTTRTR